MKWNMNYNSTKPLKTNTTQRTSSGKGESFVLALEGGAHILTDTEPCWLAPTPSCLPAPARPWWAHAHTHAHTHSYVRVHTHTHARSLMPTPMLMFILTLTLTLTPHPPPLHGACAHPSPVSGSHRLPLPQPHTWLLGTPATGCGEVQRGRTKRTK